MKVGRIGAGLCVAAVGAIVARLAMVSDLQPKPSTEEPAEAPARPAPKPLDPGPEPTVKLNAHSAQIAARARSLLDRPNRAFRDDCSGYVSSVYTAADIEMDGTVAEIYAIAEDAGLLHHHPIPTIGDLVFFDNTHDRNGNGKWDDTRTHIGVVVDVDPAGTARIAHRGSRYAILEMNLMHPMTQKDEAGETINSHLRRYAASDTWSLYLASQMWTAFASIHPEVDWVGPSGKIKRGLPVP